MINVWLIVRDDAKIAISTAISTPESQYSGPVNLKTRRIFETMADRAQVQKLFKSPSFGGNIYPLFSLYIDSSDAQQAKAAVDYLITKYPSHIIIGGAWRWDGSQIPNYPPHPQLIQIMPDVWDNTSQSYIAPSQVEDINLMLGQSPRDFS